MHTSLRCGQVQGVEIVMKAIAVPIALMLALAFAAPSQAAHRRALVLAGYRPVFGDLGKKPDFVAALARHLETLREHGVMRAVQGVA